MNRQRLSCGVLLVLCALLTASGCRPSFWRQQADAESYALVAEKSHQTVTPLTDYTINPDPRSRFFDPNAADCPPMPPDDPTAHRMMHWIDGKKGDKHWYENGVTPFIENPFWRASLPVEDDGLLRLDLLHAVELSRIQSPEYQTQLESLYLTSLDVSLQRFAFDAQFFAGYNAFFTADGPERGGISGDSSSTLDVATSGWEMRKLYATGGELVVGLANSMIWEFSGANTQSATTLIDLSLVQPLLRGAGRDVVLESLTQSERDLLANVRDLERFQRGFYAEIAVGRAAGGGGGGGGFYGLLETQQNIRNQQTNVNGLRENLYQFEELFAAGRIDRLQVDQSRQALYNAESQLLRSRNNYQTALDNYKINLGLPPQIDVELDDELFEPFKLVDPRLSAIRADALALLNTFRDPDGKFSLERWAQAEDDLQALGRRIDAHYEVVRSDLERLIENAPARRESLRLLQGELASTTLDPKDPAFSIEQFNRRVTEVQQEFKRLEADRTAAAEQFTKMLESDDRDAVTDWLIAATERMLALQLIQARAKLDTVVLTPVKVDDRVAVEIARFNRRDWKNARASLVDSWRQIRVTKNDLESQLDVVFNADIGNVGDNPVNIQSTTGRLRVGLEFDAPLTRLAERNAYRTALINYQAARRDYYTFEDNIAADLRSIVRDLQFNQVNFEISRAAVFVSIAQVDLARLRVDEPQKPGQQAAVSNTAARDVVDALSGLRGAQDSFVSDWVSYEVLRISLDLDLGTMQLDERGMWIDPGAITLDDAEAVTNTLGAQYALSIQGCTNLPPELLQWPGDNLPAPAEDDAELIDPGELAPPPGLIPEQPQPPPAEPLPIDPALPEVEKPQPIDPLPINPRPLEPQPLERLPVDPPPQLPSLEGPLQSLAPPPSLDSF